MLADVEGIGFMRFTDADVVRHPLVQSIIRAYARQAGGAGAQAERSRRAPGRPPRRPRGERKAARSGTPQSE